VELLGLGRATLPVYPVAQQLAEKSPSNSLRSCTHTRSRARARTPGRRTSPTWSGSQPGTRSTPVRSSTPLPRRSRVAPTTGGRPRPRRRRPRGPASTPPCAASPAWTPRRPPRRTRRPSSPPVRRWPASAGGRGIRKPELGPRRVRLDAVA
jgi:hypothetical protein